MYGCTGCGDGNVGRFVLDRSIDTIEEPLVSFFKSNFPTRRRHLQGDDAIVDTLPPPPPPLSLSLSLSFVLKLELPRRWPWRRWRRRWRDPWEAGPRLLSCALAPDPALGGARSKLSNRRSSRGGFMGRRSGGVRGEAGAAAPLRSSQWRASCPELTPRRFFPFPRRMSRRFCN